MAETIAEVCAALKSQLRQRLDPLGFRDFANGAFATGNTPNVAPAAYLCRWYPGLEAAEIERAEQEAGRYIPEPYRALLAEMNGARILGVDLQGFTGPLLDRSVDGIGQPISLRYQNLWERPAYIPEGHLGIGGMNGEWASQGHLYLASTGEVEMHNAGRNLIGARWPTLQAFLAEEIPRRFTLYDADWVQAKGAKLLPGATDDWEALAQADKAQQTRRRQGLLSMLKKLFS